MKIDRSRDWWLSRVDAEPDAPIGAGPPDSERVWRGPGVGWVETPTPAQRFRVGDVVTRGDGDRHTVTAVNGAGDLIDVICTVGAYWCQPGDTESNLASRYMHAGVIIEGNGHAG